MVSLKVTFLAGRYHATPWGRNVNEGVVEWPPSPWRILRALVSSWKRCCPELDAGRLSRILRVLAAPPVFLLPRASVGHTRHFMPNASAGVFAPESRDRVFDPFVAVSREDVVSVVWPDAELSQDDRLLLKRVVSRLPYLGRAEAWCDARVATSGEEEADRKWLCRSDVEGPPVVCRAASDEEVLTSNMEPVPLLVAEPWDANAVLADGHPLLVDTTTVRHEMRLLQPPGSRWVTYLRPRQALEADVQPRSSPRVAVVHVARYALDAPVLPLVTDTVWVAEAMREAIQSEYGELSGGGASPTFSGHDPAGGPAKGHGHARYLPLDEDGDRRLDHVTVVSTNGFTRSDRKALAAVTYLLVGTERTKVRLIPLGMTTLELARSGQVRLCDQGEVWESVTPFVLSRYPKKKSDSPIDQLRREARQLGLPEIVNVERVEKSAQGFRWLEFRRWRRRGPAPAMTRGYGFRVRFERPIEGPLALGYGSHFGLGLFLPQ
jgi:CRISPR-associated protein Csb2